METALFWIAWGIISFWALRTFYFSFSKEKLERLRKAAMGLNLAVFVLTFVPWLPESFGGKSALILALSGNILATLFLILLTASLMLLWLNDALFLKTAAVLIILNTVILFLLMVRLRPETFALSFFDIAPIIATFLLLVCNVVVLLLWQQLQLKARK